MHPIIRDIADDDRAYDPWGAGMMALGAVCDVLAVNGETVPANAGYRPGVFGPHIDPDDSNAQALLAGLNPEEFPSHWVDGYEPNLSVDDLQYAAVILSRYLDWVRIAGRDY